MMKRGSALLLSILLLFTANVLFAARTELISRSPSGEPGSSDSMDPSISEDARYIVYESSAKNLVTDKTTSNRDIFLYDRVTKKTRRISISNGEEANSSSYDAEISADGNVIVFTSQASNLVSNDTEGKKDIFAYDKTTGKITRVSVSSAGVAADGDSEFSDVSGDGRYVVFESEATNLVSGDTNEKKDIFRHDRTTGKTVRVSYDFLDNEITDHDSEEPVISNDGRYIAFQTRASLVPCDDNKATDVYVRDMVDGLTTHASVTYYGCVPHGSSNHPSISGNGRFVTFASSATDLVMEEDTNKKNDLFIRDLEKLDTERISIASNGTEGDERSVGYGGNISADGRYVVFSSPSTTFASEDQDKKYDVYARDRQTKKTTQEGVGHYFEQGSGDESANTAVISANGKYIVFDSNSGELVPGDDNNDWDIYIRDYLYTGPYITKIKPQSGDFRGGTLLTLVGANFDAGADVTIDGISALNIKVNGAGTLITCITPPHEVGAVSLQVTNPDGAKWIYPIGRGAFNGFLYRPLALPYLMLLPL